MMSLLSLCQKLCPNHIPVQIGERLGCGVDGEVFAIKDDPLRAIKLGRLYEQPQQSVQQQFQHLEKVLQLLQHEHSPAYVYLHEYGYLCTSSQQRFAPPRRRYTQQFVLYYYIMDRLIPITEDEGKVLHSILSHEDRGIKKDFSAGKVREMLIGMSTGLDFDIEKITLFCHNIKEAPFLHLDIAIRNIMKNGAGEFKLIDIDRMSLEKVNANT